MVKHSNPKDMCPRCGKGQLVTDNESGEMFCSKCGFVLSEKLQESGPEWRSFTQDEHGDRARAGAPTSLTMHDMGLATIINPVNKDASGRPLTASMKSTIERLRTWDSRSQVHEPVDRNFRQAFSELNRLKDKMAISDAVIEKAAYIYRKALEKGLVRGRSISALMASALYAACRDTATPRNLKDVEQAANIKRKDIARCYRLLVKELDLKMPVTDSIQCVARIASRIGIAEKNKKIRDQGIKSGPEKRDLRGQGSDGARSRRTLSVVREKRRGQDAAGHSRGCQRDGGYHQEPLQGPQGIAQPLGCKDSRAPAQFKRTMRQIF